MTNPSNSDVQNLLPVQAYFNLDGSFNTFIGQGVPFYATANPDQSGLNITNSTINSTTIGATTPSTGVFTNIATTTGTISTQPTGATDIVNLLALQSYAAGISWKQPCAAATLVNITLSGLQTIDGYTTLAGDRVLVKNQATAANNGIYLASATAWTRSLDADTWDDLICAISFIEYGTQAGGAWFCSAQPGGTLGVTAVNWSQFTTSATYSAGTGLTLTGSVFSITPVGTASTYGSATQTPVFTTNANGQVTAVTNTTITPAVGSITGFGTGVATALAVNTGAAGAFVVNGGPLGTPTSGDFSTGTFTWPTFNQSTTGNAATATTATNIAGGLAGSLPYQSALNTTTFLAAGTNGQVLTLASGVPSWATPTSGTVTSVGGTGTVSGITLSGTVTSSGNLTLGGTLDLSAPPAIGGTTANTITGTTITASTKFVGPYFDAANSAGGALRNASGTAIFQWGAGGGTNASVDGSINLNGTNAQIDISPTGTGHVHINPTGSGSIEMNPTSAGVMNNMVIGGTTPAAGTFTTLRVNSTLSLAGSTGTSGYVLTSNGASAPTWQAAASTGLTITDDTTTSTDLYATFTSATSGTITGANTSSTKFKFKPSTGTLTVVDAIFSGTTAITLPVGTTAQRPGTPTNGMLRLNTTLNAMEVYSSSLTDWEIISYFTKPGAPTIGTATAVSSTSATVTYTAPASNGGSTITSYTAVASPGGQTGTVSQSGSGTITVSGLTTGTSYTFTVYATNAGGNSASSSASNSITTWSVPGAPTIGTATATGSTTATVAYTAPASNGGTAITSYTAVSSPGGITGTLSQAGSGTITVSGLSASTSYTFTVYATNAVGNSANSAASNSITTLSATYSADMLIGAGGAGGGGAAHGGGGGAGGVRTATQNLTAGSVYTITVGGAGTRGGGNPSGIKGGNGGDSTISGSGITTITSTGGGGGGSQGAVTGNNGGAGGGGGNNPGSGSGGTGNTPSTSPSQGADGGAGNYSGAPYPGGGGGGSANVGGTATAGGNGGNGGDGKTSSITGSSVYYGGGGGGSTYSGGTPGNGGLGGGGNGNNGGGTGFSASFYCGAGGGGGGPGDNSLGGLGYAGVVILSVPTSRYTGTTTGSPGVTTNGSNTVMTFTGSGSYTA